MMKFKMIFLLSFVFIGDVLLADSANLYTQCIKDSKSFRDSSSDIPAGYDNNKIVAVEKAYYGRSYMTLYITEKDFVEKMTDSYIEQKCLESEYHTNYKKIHNCIDDIHNPISFNNPSRNSNYVNEFWGENELVYLLDRNPNVSKFEVSEFCDKNFDNTQEKNAIKTCTLDFDRILSTVRYLYSWSDDDDLFKSCTNPEFRKLISQKLSSDKELSENKTRAKNKVINNSIMNCYETQLSDTKTNGLIDVPEVLYPLFEYEDSARKQISKDYYTLSEKSRYNNRVLGLLLYAKCKNKKYGKIPLYSFYEDDVFNGCIITSRENGSKLNDSEDKCVSLRNVEDLTKNLKEISIEKMRIEGDYEIADVPRDFLKLYSLPGFLFMSIGQTLYDTIFE